MPIVIETNRLAFCNLGLRLPPDLVEELDRDAVALNASRTLVAIVKLDAPLVEFGKSHLFEVPGDERVFAIRVPLPMRGTLRREANGLSLSINRLCVAKLLCPLSVSQRQLVDRMAETKHREVGWHYVPPGQDHRAEPSTRPYKGH